jgi:norsolorinic acid ketoreductase
LAKPSSPPTSQDQTTSSSPASAIPPATPRKPSTVCQPHGANSKVIIVKIVSASETDAKEAVATLKSTHNISKLEVVIANAGIADFWGTALLTPANEMLEHFKVNIVGPLLLFQATAELLESAKKPKFVVITSAVGSIAFQESFPIPSTAYGASKTAVNFATRKIHFEHPKIIAVPIHPGWLRTDVSPFRERVR